jgi:hypothetical protein
LGEGKKNRKKGRFCKHFMAGLGGSEGVVQTYGRGGPFMGDLQVKEGCSLCPGHITQVLLGSLCTGTVNSAQENLMCSHTDLSLRCIFNDTES